MTRSADPTAGPRPTAARRPPASHLAPLPPDDRSEPAAAAASSTRERILDVALDLFVDQGYDATSLRQIAERLGVTKAALYYHFEAKEDILAALHMRLHEFGKNALITMAGDEPITLEAWGALLDEVVDQMLVQRKLFLMHERNQAALEKLHSEGHDAEHEDVQNQLRRVLADPRLPMRDRVRMAASMGAVFAGLFLPGEAFPESDNKELGRLLRECLHDVLHR
jgi:AcrR family transcriptional regulator